MNDQANCSKCPPAIKMKSICRDIDSLKDAKERIWARRDLDYEHWENAISKRAKTTTLMGVASIVTVIMIALFGGIWHTTTAGMEKISAEIKEQSEKIDKANEKIEALNIDVGIVKSRLNTHMQRTEVHKGK